MNAMNTKEQASQLRLAAGILETGHPFEAKHRSTEKWAKRKMSVTEYSINEYEIRIILATPPDGRPLHNPDNLTAEQVGVGYRLGLVGEPANVETEKQEFWSRGSWVKSGEVYSKTFDADPNSKTTYRLPLSVPWPALPIAELPKSLVELDAEQHAVEAVLKEAIHDPYAELKAAHAAGKVIQILDCGDWVDWDGSSWTFPLNEYRIKPEPEPFQLPAPPPGVEWHDSGWTADMLPRGFRPLHIGEQICKDDEYFAWNEGPWGKTQDGPTGDKSGNHIEDNDVKYRTTRPLTFTHLGKTWTWHKAGDPMPCDGERIVQVTLVSGSEQAAYLASSWRWTQRGSGDIIGWRYAETESATKTVDLGPEDVPPGSVLRLNTWDVSIYVTPSVWRSSVSFATAEGVTKRTYEDLRVEGFQINRPANRDADGNPTKWEPCHKQIPA